MNGLLHLPKCWIVLYLVILAATSGFAAETLDQNLSKDEAQCRALLNIPNLTILTAELVDAKGDVPQYCHVTGLFDTVRWHMQMPRLDASEGISGPFCRQPCL